MEQGIETISSGSSSNGGGHCQTKVGKVGGKVIFRGSHFSPSPNPVLNINRLPMLSYLFFFLIDSITTFLEMTFTICICG